MWTPWGALKDRREARRRAALDALKVRYHTFRILLANNERALDRLAKVEAALETGAATAELTGLVEDLQAVTFELVDGVSRLTDGGHQLLYARQLRLEEALRVALETMEETARQPSCQPLGRNLAPKRVGGKAASLSLLKQNGFPVPDGFAVTARACRDFLREAGLDGRIRKMFHAAGSEGPGLADACERARQAVMDATLPDWLREDLRQAGERLAANGSARLAARSSALTEDMLEHSFAGQYVTVLNLTPDTLENGFLEVMAGVFGQRAVAYRLQAGLPAAACDMAVLVQEMVPAVGAGVLFTLDPVRPASGRLLVSAVPGLGILAVDGEAPTDIFRVSRDDLADVLARPATKTIRAVPDPAGGVRREAVPEDERERPVVSPETLARLCRLGLASEALAGAPQDMEWAVTASGELRVLQSRPVRLTGQAGGATPDIAGGEYFHGGMAACPGRCLGRTRHVRGPENLDTPIAGPVIAVLAAATPEAARLLPSWQGVVAAGGNPTDHLSTVARELGRPMLTRATGAITAIPDGVPAVLDAAAGSVSAMPAVIGDLSELLAAPRPETAKAPRVALTPGRARVRELTVPLNLTNAYGPTFAAVECQSLHDIIRFAHEAAILALFEAGDELLDEAFSHVRILRGNAPFEVMVIDLGGGVREDATGRFITAGDLTSQPLAALWQGLNAGATPYATPPSGPNGRDVSGVMGRGITDARGKRPVGEPNYALAARDYVNVNARVEFHFAMIDAVCGPRTRGNYVRLRVKGGGAATPLRERRATCLADILAAAGFYVDRRGDLVTASLTDVSGDDAAKGLVLLGRLLSFMRLLDAAMTDDDAPARAADAFWAQAGETAIPADAPAQEAS
ncbi:pyruvate, phosphate dikinase [Desulfovibrio sp. JY]|nr:pyruvate, phosphate dikinase [Desulfovibrio sp. JY]